MDEMKTSWSKEELHTYLFIYCINADLKETKEEIDFVKAKVSEETYQRMHAEFEKDSDYASIQKLQSTFQRFGYTKTELDQLFEEVKELFLADGVTDIMEKNLLMGLKHVLRWKRSTGSFSDFLFSGKCDKALDFWGF